MNTALVLSPTNLAALTVRESATPTPRISRAAEGASYVYGDSTPFPHDGNYIEILYDAVESCVSLMRAEHSIQRAMARADEAEKRRQIMNARLFAMADSVKRALTGDLAATVDRVASTGARGIASTRGAIESEVAALQAETRDEVAHARRDMETARHDAALAVEAFAARHDLPMTRVALRMRAAGDASCAAETFVRTPYGLDAIFDLSIPASHLWAKPRRVFELAPNTVIHVPVTAGWITKRIKPEKRKLDKLFVRAVSADAEGCVLTLGKALHGEVCELEIDARVDPPRAMYREVGRDGVNETHELGGDDRDAAVRLALRVVETSEDLRPLRRGMRSAMVFGKPLADQRPQEVCRRIVDTIAPTAAEIGRRSGAPGELVLRRDAGTWRRDEVYVTKAELMEKITTLPPRLREAFAPLELDGPRSPRAPARSLPTYDEVEDGDLLD